MQKQTNASLIGSGLHLTFQPHEFAEADPYSSRYLTSAIRLEHFHFYSEQDRAAKCGFSSTPASLSCRGTQVRSVHQHGNLSLNQFHDRRVAKSLFGTVSLSACAASSATEGLRRKGKSRQ